LDAWLESEVPEAVVGGVVPVVVDVVKLSAAEIAWPVTGSAAVRFPETLWTAALGLVPEGRSRGRATVAMPWGPTLPQPRVGQTLTMLPETKLVLP